MRVAAEVSAGWWVSHCKVVGSSEGGGEIGTEWWKGHCRVAERAMQVAVEVSEGWWRGHRGGGEVAAGRMCNRCTSDIVGKKMEFSQGGGG